MSNLEKLILFFVFVFVGLGVVSSHMDLSYFESVYAREDGVVEWFTVLALWVGTVITAKRVIDLRKERTTWFTVCLCILAFLFFFGAGEEISWGQRILMVKSPEFFVEHNSQMETNLHNLILGGVKINKLVFGTILGILVGLYFLILPVAYHKNTKVRELVNSWAIPIPRKSHLMMYLLLIMMVKMTASPKKGELLEFAGCWIFLMLAYNPLNVDIYKKRF